MEIKKGLRIYQDIKSLPIQCRTLPELINKNWVSVESILKLLKDESIICFADLQDQVIEELEERK